MKICFVLRLHNNTPSGGRKIVYSYANYLATHGNEVTILFVGDTPFNARKHNLIKTFIHFPKYFKLAHKQQTLTWYPISPTVKLQTQFQIRRKKIQDQDKIVAFDYGISLSLYELGTDLRDRVFHMIQADERIYDSRDIVEAAWKLPTKKIVVSSWLQRLISTFDKNVFLVRNYAELNDFFVQKQIGERKRIISLLNHPMPSKRSKVGVELLEKVRGEFPDLKIIMFGNGPRPMFLNSADEYIESATPVQLRTKVFNESIIYLQMSTSEGWGLTASEAMACGCVLVSAENGGLEDFAENKVNSLIFPRDNLSVAEKLISNVLKDTELAKRLSTNAVNSVSKFTFKRSITKLMSVLFQDIS